ncbi:ABC transporter permease [Aureimonas sp. Leaf460]|nr:ABC transporter permease [Aureimonas sp. Leaf460]KQT69334.1 ABC transporter permease [Aureimonas sp. Leaf427]
MPREPWDFTAVLALPLLAFLAIFYAFPVLGMLSRSFSGPEGWLSAYESVLFTGSFWRVLGITASVSLVTTSLCLVLAYPLAYFMARLGEGTANILFVLVLVPFWTSILVRTYAWMVLLGRRGLVNDALIALGFVDRPLQLLNTRIAVTIAMVHVLLPFMVLPLYSTLRSLDWRLMDAAKGLGASPLSAFRQVILPLSGPGIAAGTVLVFTLAIGFYITPALVGGPSDMMISMLIENRVRQFDWPAAAAMAAILLSIVLAVCAVFARFVPLNPVVRR